MEAVLGAGVGARVVSHWPALRLRYRAFERSKWRAWCSVQRTCLPSVGLPQSTHAPSPGGATRQRRADRAHASLSCLRAVRLAANWSQQHPLNADAEIGLDLGPSLAVDHPTHRDPERDRVPDQPPLDLRREPLAVPEVDRESSLPIPHPHEVDDAVAPRARAGVERRNRAHHRPRWFRWRSASSTVFTHFASSGSSSSGWRSSQSPIASTNGASICATGSLLMLASAARVSIADASSIPSHLRALTTGAPERGSSPARSA